jgi:hypothetical protein
MVIRLRVIQQLARTPALALPGMLLSSRFFRGHGGVSVGVLPGGTGGGNWGYGCASNAGVGNGGDISVNGRTHGSQV